MEGEKNKNKSKQTKQKQKRKNKFKSPPKVVRNLLLISTLFHGNFITIALVSQLPFHLNNCL